MVDATIAAEDRRFRDHPGVDPFAIARAIVKLPFERSGASTLTQQLARRLYIDASTPLLERKAEEALVAMQLEARYSKDEILAMYLNEVYYGNGAYGIEAAARIYFGVSAAAPRPGAGRVPRRSAAAAGAIRRGRRRAPALRPRPHGRRTAASATPKRRWPRRSRSTCCRRSRTRWRRTSSTTCWTSLRAWRPSWPASPASSSRRRWTSACSRTPRATWRISSLPWRTRT